MRTVVPSRQPAFTLLETLMAGAIIVLTITVSVASGRTIQQAATRNQQSARVGAVLNEGLDKAMLATNNTVSTSTGPPADQVINFYWGGCVNNGTTVTVDFTRSLINYDGSATSYLTNFGSIPGNYYHSYSGQCGTWGFEHDENLTILDKSGGYTGYGLLSGSATALPSGTQCDTISLLKGVGPSATYLASVNPYLIDPLTSLPATQVPNASGVKVQIQDPLPYGANKPLPYSFFLSCAYKGTSASIPFYKAFDAVSAHQVNHALTVYWSGCVLDKSKVSVDFTNAFQDVNGNPSPYSTDFGTLQPNNYSGASRGSCGDYGFENVNNKVGGYTGYGVISGADGTLPSGTECSNIRVSSSSGPSDIAGDPSNVNDPNNPNHVDHHNPGILDPSAGTVLQSDVLSNAHAATVQVEDPSTYGSAVPSLYSFQLTCTYPVTVPAYSTFVSPGYISLDTAGNTVAWNPAAAGEAVSVDGTNFYRLTSIASSYGGHVVTVQVLDSNHVSLAKRSIFVGQ